MRSYLLKYLLSAVYMFTIAKAASGAGFALAEKSPRWLGTANAGGAAAADNPATIYFNPAGLTRLRGMQTSGGINLIFPSSHFRDEGSTHLSGQPLSGSEGGDPANTAIVPNLYFSRRVNERLAVGVGLYSPFGLSTDYSSTWVGRYHALQSKLTTVDINPVIACRITDRFSLGAGIAAEYLKARLSNAIDFGTIFALQAVPGAVPQATDGFVTFEGDSWSWGYSVGGLYEFSENTRAGLVYHSRVDHTLRGNAHFSGVPSPNPTGRFRDGAVKSDVALPDSISVSLWHQFSSEFAVMADITWTNWSTIDEIRIRFDNPSEADSVTTVNWHNTFRYSAGAVYMPDRWQFRVGVGFDESPVPDDAHRTPRIPDSDRTWLTFGIGCRISPRVAIDAAYAHLFAQDAAIRKTAAGENLFRGALSGSYDGSADIFAVGVSWSY